MSITHDPNGMSLREVSSLINIAMSKGTMQERESSRQNPMVLIVQGYEGTRFIVTDAEMTKHELILTLDLAF